MKKLLLLPLMAAAIALPTSGFSQVLYDTQTKTFGFSPSGNVDLVFDQVDIDLADVFEIKITFQLTKTGGSLAVDNDSMETGQVTFVHTLRGTLTSDDVGIVDGSLNSAWATMDAVSSTVIALDITSGDATDEFNATGQSDYAEFAPDPESVSNTASIYSNAWGGYLGSGTYAIKVAADQLTSATGLGGIQQAIVVSEASGSVTVEIYTVPEPTTVFLLGLGAFVMLLRRRRK